MTAPKALCRFVPLIALAAASCRSLPSVSQVIRSIERGEGRGRVIAGVPFIPQSPLGCGPAALASVLRYHGAPGEPGAIAEGQLVPSVFGVRTYELAVAARKQGMFARDVRFVCGEGAAPPLRKLVAFLDAGLPVIVLLRHERAPSGFHYALAVGYEDSHGLIVLQDGVTSGETEAYAVFHDRWHAAGHWGLVVFPPEQSYPWLSPEDSMELAELCEARGSWSAAAAHYQRVLAAQPANVAALSGCAAAFSQLGKSGEAAAHFEAAIARDPEDPRSLNGYAEHLVRVGGDLGRAEAFARKALASAPALAPYVLDTLGQILLAKGDVEAARTALETALSGTKPHQARLRAAIARRLQALDPGGASSGQAAPPRTSHRISEASK